MEMEGQHPTAESGEASRESPAPKRILRKGTRSCNECKRRKTRCFFDSPSATVCVGCQRRGTGCLGQELFDVPGAPSGYGFMQAAENRMSERLERVEDLLVRLADRVLADGAASSSAGKSSVRPSPRSQSAEDSIVVVARSDAGDEDDDDDIGDSPDGMKIVWPTAPIAARPLHMPQQDQAAKPSKDAPLAIALPAQDANVSLVLHAAFPSPQDAAILLGTGRTSIFLQAICNPYYDLFLAGQNVPPAALAELPGPTCHPAVLARKLLHLALAIQQLDPSFDRRVLHLGPTPLEAMARYADLAAGLVTCHDRLLDSLEGLECLAMEAVYQCNAGNLRRALSTARRATTLMQLMGMHRPQSRTTPRQLDKNTHISCTVVWAHMAYLERYLSLLINVPTAVIPSISFSRPERDTDTATEKLDRAHTDIIGRIMQRNNSRASGGGRHDDYDRNDDGEYEDDISLTQRLDAALHRAATAFEPAGLWGPLHLPPGLPDAEVMWRVIGAQSQTIHYNLLTVLHLPYLLQRNVHPEQTHPDQTRRPTEDFDDNRTRFLEYSRATCCYAARETLTRFVAFRSVFRIVFCCRLVDFCALTASLALLLAHLDGHRRRRRLDHGQQHPHVVSSSTEVVTSRPGGRGGPDVLLAHQRLSDRALVQRAMAVMDELNALNGDELSKETAHLTRRILTLEAQAARGGDTFTAAVGGAASGEETDGAEGVASTDAVTDVGATVRLKIPYFGTVRLARDCGEQVGVESRPGNPASIPSRPHPPRPTPSSTAASTAAALTPASSSASVAFQSWHSPGGALLAGHEQPLTPASASGRQVHHHGLQLQYPELDQHRTKFGFPAAINFPSGESPAVVASHSQHQTGAEIAAVDRIGLDDADLAMTDLMAGADDWAFQGVDAAFFDSAVGGAWDTWDDTGSTRPFFSSG